MEPHAATTGAEPLNSQATARLPVHVVATSPEATRLALGTAARLATGLEPRIIVLVPLVVPYAVPLDGLPGDATVLGERYSAIASAVGVDVTVRVCLCRRPDDVFRALLPGRSIVVVGGRRRRFLPTATERLARALEALGHQVVLADGEQLGGRQRWIS